MGDQGTRGGPDQDTQPLYRFASLGENHVVCRREGPYPNDRITDTSRILLSGDLAIIEVADLVNFLSMSRLTGILLLIIDGNHEKSLHFNKGELVFASSSASEDRLGEVLVRLGQLNQRQLEAVSIKFPGNMKIGRFLVQQELISPQGLWEGIRQQVREIFFGFLEAEHGVFFLLDARPSASEELNLSLTTHNLLLEGVQRKDELAHFRKRIQNDEVILRKRHPLPTKELTANERRLLNLVDGKQDISQLSRLSQLERFITLKTLFHLMQTGFVEICDTSVEEPPRVEKASTDEPGAIADERQLRDIVGVFNEIYVEVLQALTQKMPAAGALKTLNAFFQNPEPHLVPLFRGIKLGGGGTLDASALLRNLRAMTSADAGTCLTDGLKELFFFCVFEATSRLDPSAEEALLERVQKLQKNLRG
ncbi:MAG: DUF4388 domain-containing protein [Deltaproteobacteria bacterium]|nr:DUF4388 domain-containing protein [Deltaproteobacteria bacterium]